MRVLRHPEMAAKPFHPIAGLAEKSHFLFMRGFTVFIMIVMTRGHCAGFRLFALVENRGVIAAVKRNIRLREEVIGKHPPAVAEQEFQNIARLGAITPRSGAGLQGRRQ